jgi:hypothetical protein
LGVNRTREKEQRGDIGACGNRVISEITPGVEFAVKAEEAHRLTIGHFGA